jgi:hypothetical protein
MRILWIVQNVPADGLVTGDYLVADKMARALAALGVECAIVPARTARTSLAEYAPDRVMVIGFLEGTTWEYIGGLGDHVPTVFWWLTMHFTPTWGEDVVRPSRFVAIATNSETAFNHLVSWGRHRPLFLPLAADERDLKASALPSLAHPVVFLGIGQHKDRAQEEMLLGPAREFGLAIYGARWKDTPWAPWWRGPLPVGLEASLYRSSRVALGMTEHEQVRMGMINNRPFEVLAAGAPCILPHYPTLEAFFGDRLLYTRSAAETYALLRGVLAGEVCVPDSRDWISRYHTYRHRAQQLVEFLMDL